MPIFGNGFCDDTAAIQQLIDSSHGELTLPAPEKYYLISRPLELPSYFRLTLPRYAEIRLADGSNCPMLKNKSADCGIADRQKIRFRKPLPEKAEKELEVCGGIWNLNNLGQQPSPLTAYDPAFPEYSGYGFCFINVRGLKLCNLTLKDPVTFGVTLDTVSYFTIENIVFDYNYGNPIAGCMDGIHMNGNCRFGLLRNLKGSCYDDLVALNADEGTGGPISDIDIDGIFAEDCHSAVRLLAVDYALTNVHIHNVFGTFYQYCVGITKYYQGTDDGYFDAVVLDHIFASKAVRHTVYQKDGTYVFPLIYVEGKLRVKSLSISQLHRRETTTPVATIYIGKGTVVENLSLDQIFTENLTGAAFPELQIDGTVINRSFKH